MVDRRRDMVLVGARPNEERYRAGGRVLRRQPPEDALDFELALGARQVERLFQQLAGGHIGEERVDIGDADAREHVLAVGLGQGR